MKIPFMKQSSTTNRTLEVVLLPVTVGMFVVLSIWWVLIYLSGATDGFANHAFGFIYGGFSLWGALWGFLTAQLWGGRKSLMGKAILGVACGLACQAFGQYSFWFYNYALEIAVPYPGIPDIGYFGTIICYFYAAIQMAKAAGAKLTLRTFAGHIHVVVIPTIMVSIAYFLFLKEYSFDASHLLKTLLDYGYPLGQALYISIVLLTLSLSHKFLGGVMRTRILVLVLAFMAQFVCDYIFIYFAASYFPASFIDFFYLLSYFLMSVAILFVRQIALVLRSKA